MRTPPELRTTINGLRATAPFSRPHPVFSLGIIAFACAFVVFPVSTFAWGSAWWKWLAVSPFILFGACVLLVGLWMLTGSRTIIVRAGELSLRYAIGPIGSGRTLRPGKLERLRVRDAPSGEDASITDMPYRLEAIRPKSARHTEKSRVVVLAEGEDPSWLVRWGEEIGRATGARFAPTPAVRAALSTPRDDGVERPVLHARYPRPEPDTPFRLDVARGHVTISGALDKQGRKRARGWVWMGLIFVGVTSWAGRMFLAGTGVGGVPATIGILSIVVLFFLVGIAMLVHGLRAARARWIIDVTRGTLVVTSITHGRTASRTIDGARVRSVRVGHSGVSEGSSVDSTPIKQLQIVPTSGPWIRLMDGCADASLAWTARVLQIALALERPDEETEEGV